MVKFSGKVIKLNGDAFRSLSMCCGILMKHFFNESESRSSPFFNLTNVFVCYSLLPFNCYTFCIWNESRSLWNGCNFVSLSLWSHFLYYSFVPLELFRFCIVVLSTISFDAFHRAEIVFPTVNSFARSLSSIVEVLLEIVSKEVSEFRSSSCDSFEVFSCESPEEPGGFLRFVYSRKNHKFLKEIS